MLLIQAQCCNCAYVYSGVWVFYVVPLDVYVTHYYNVTVLCKEFCQQFCEFINELTGHCLVCFRVWWVVYSQYC